MFTSSHALSELKGVMEHSGGIAHLLPPHLASQLAGQWIGEVRQAPAYSGLVGGLEPVVESPAELGITLRPGMTMAEIERAAIEVALRNSRGNRRKAAEVLQIGERTLYRKLREYHLVPDDASDGIDDAEGSDGDDGVREAGVRHRS